MFNRQYISTSYCSSILGQLLYDCIIFLCSTCSDGLSKSLWDPETFKAIALETTELEDMFENQCNSDTLWLFCINVRCHEVQQAG